MFCSFLCKIIMFTVSLTAADHVKPAATEPKQENQVKTKLKKWYGLISIVHTITCLLMLQMDLVSHMN